MKHELIRAIGAFIVRDNREIGCFLRSKDRSKRSGETDYFMGGEVKDGEAPIQAVLREFDEKAKFSGKAITERGTIDSTVPEGMLQRTIFRVDVFSGVEPTFTDPLPNRKFSRFEWIAIEVLQELVERDEIHPEVAQMLQMISIS